MKKIILIFIFIIMSSGLAHAGYLTGNSSPYLKEKGSYAVKINSTIVMVGTPFSALCLAGKYAFDEKINMFGKYGIGTIDYTTITGVKLTTDPQVSALGLEYILNGTREAQHDAFVIEYETVAWSINKVSNASTEMLLGWDFSVPVSANLRTRYRVAINNFNAGTESEEKIDSTVKYSLSTEIEYYFTKYFRCSFEGGIYFGDPNGLISTFGLGLGFNS